QEHRVMLQLVRVGSVAGIRLNGEFVGVLRADPLEIDVTKHLKRGKNKFEIKVYNNWGSRFGYENSNESAEKRVQTIAPPKYLKELQPAGLHGNVYLKWYQKK